MKTISVRISEEEKRQLKKYGKLSDTLREGMKLYLNKKKSEEILFKLEKLQSESHIKTSIEEEVKLIREDRNR
ncbi:MAG TPA: hypothetical protein VF350_01940 [Candidatus Bathyarchaeia archaeon]